MIERGGIEKLRRGRKKNLGMRKIKGQEKASRNQGNREVEGSGNPRDEKIESRDANKSRARKRIKRGTPEMLGGNHGLEKIKSRDAKNQGQAKSKIKGKERSKRCGTQGWMATLLFDPSMSALSLGFQGRVVPVLFVCTVQ